MAPTERDEVLNSLAGKIFSAMLEDIVMDAALQSHRETMKSRAVCAVCSTQCGSAHAIPVLKPTQNQASTSRAGTPSSLGDGKLVNGFTANGSSSAGNIKMEGDQNLPCVICTRTIAPSRYASHLSSCMGLGTSRRGAARGTAIKVKNPSEADRSVSPASELASDDSKATKGKGRAKIKNSDKADFNLKRKRPTSPQISPHKKTKKPKASGSPVSRVKADTDVSKYSNAGTHYSPSLSQSKIPSKLRDSSTIIEGSPSQSSRSSTPEVPSAATPSSSFSAQSPSMMNKSIGNGRLLNNKAMGIGPPKRLSPPKPLPVHVPSYTFDADGDETGSSTDEEDSS